MTNLQTILKINNLLELSRKKATSQSRLEHVYNQFILRAIKAKAQVALKTQVRDSQLEFTEYSDFETPDQAESHHASYSQLSDNKQVSLYWQLFDKKRVNLTRKINRLTVVKSVI